MTANNAEVSLIPKSEGPNPAPMGLEKIMKGQVFTVDDAGCDCCKFVKSCCMSYENNYAINAGEEAVFTATEKANGCIWLCCNPNHGAEIEIKNTLGDAVMNIDRPCSLPPCCPVCTEGLQWEAKMTDQKGSQFGLVKFDSSCCKNCARPTYAIYGADGGYKAVIEGPSLCIGGLCCLDTFNLLRDRTGDDIGQRGILGKIERSAEEGTGTACPFCPEKKVVPNCMCPLCPGFDLESNFRLNFEGETDPTVRLGTVATRILNNHSWFRHAAVCRCTICPKNFMNPLADTVWTTLELHILVWLWDCFCFGGTCPLYFDQVIEIDLSGSGGD